MANFSSIFEEYLFIFWTELLECTSQCQTNCIFIMSHYICGEIDEIIPVQAFPLGSGTFQLWHLGRCHQCLEHYRFWKKYLARFHTIALEGQHTANNIIGRKFMI
jgi:hypothetical protein